MINNIIIKELQNSFESIDEDKLKKIIKSLNNSNRIFVYGTGRSGLMLKAFAMRLMQLGYTSYVVGETITPSIEKGDLLVLASASGTTDSVLSLAKKCKELEVNTTVITANEQSELSKIKYPDLLIRSSDKYSQNQFSVQPMGSLFEQMLLLVLDSVVYEIYKNQKNIEKLQKNHTNLE